jgi:hypothetical protein
MGVYDGIGVAQRQERSDPRRCGSRQAAGARRAVDIRSPTAGGGLPVDRLALPPDTSSDVTIFPDEGSTTRRPFRVRSLGQAAVAVDGLGQTLSPWRVSIGGIPTA